VRITVPVKDASCPTKFALRPRTCPEPACQAAVERAARMNLNSYGAGGAAPGMGGAERAGRLFPRWWAGGRTFKSSLKL
jgi:hypothetical protein